MLAGIAGLTASADERVCFPKVARGPLLISPAIGVITLKPSSQATARELERAGDLEVSRLAQVLEFVEKPLRGICVARPSHHPIAGWLVR